jgi:hypothetical protein
VEISLIWTVFDFAIAHLKWPPFGGQPEAGENAYPRGSGQGLMWGAATRAAQMS